MAHTDVYRRCYISFLLLSHSL